jgi:hypothetical protein
MYASKQQQISPRRSRPAFDLFELGSSTSLSFLPLKALQTTTNSVHQWPLTTMGISIIYVDQINLQPIFATVRLVMLV